MTASKIEWCDRSDWNPIRGCTRVSPGCGGPGPNGGCYAEGIAARFSGPGMAFEGYAEMRNGVARWTGKVGLIEDRLLEPLHWRKPAKVFALSMSDLFHEGLPIEDIIRVLAVIALCPHLTMQVLTKRSSRLREIMNIPDIGGLVWTAADRIACDVNLTEAHTSADYLMGGRAKAPWPLPNLWLGVSVEDQVRADERIPDLVETPAAVRFLSMEPLLEDVDVSQWVWNFTSCNNCPGPKSEDCCRDPGIEDSKLHLVIIGGESGPKARPFNVTWARNVLYNGRESGVKFFVKQLGAKPFWDCANGLGAWADHVRFTRVHDNHLGSPSLNGAADMIALRDRKGGDLDEWPDDLRVREMPEVQL